MDLPERDLENLLRQAPQPTPPKDLRKRLLAQAPPAFTRTLPHPAAFAPAIGTARSNGANHAAPDPRLGQSRIRPLGLGGWLRRWWPSLVPAAGTLACAAMITAQRLEIRDLRSTIETLKQAPVQVDTPPATPALESVSGPANFDAESAPNLEIARLKQMAGVLEAEVGRLTRLRAENATLRTKLAAAATPELTADEAAAMAQAREQALSIRCVNNLKQFGLAVRIWSLDNHDLMPPDMLSLSNELVTPKVLICPADTAHQVARDWASFSRASSSYEFLAPSGSQDESTRVLSRCPIHGHIGLCDGSVQMGAVTNSPAWFHERDGKLYFDQPATLQIIPHNSGK